MKFNFQNFMLLNFLFFSYTSLNSRQLTLEQEADFKKNYADLNSFIENKQIALEKQNIKDYRYIIALNLYGDLAKNHDTRNMGVLIVWLEKNLDNFKNSLQITNCQEDMVNKILASFLTEHGLSSFIVSLYAIDKAFKNLTAPDSDIINKLEELNIKFLNFLIQNGADINTIIRLCHNTEKEDNDIKITGTVLHHAVNLEIIELISYLLNKYRSNINSKDAQERTPLILALENYSPEKNNLETINLILNHNPEVNIFVNKNSALKIAIQKNLISTCAKLQERGAILEAPLKSNYIPFF